MAKKRSGTRWFAIFTSVVVVASLGGMIWANRLQTPQMPAPSSQASAPPINGIRCETEEGNVSHYHAHLTVIHNGQKVAVPANIGIKQNAGCLYWVHTHDATGEIHIESPVNRTYTLGDFFDIWGQPLSQQTVGTYTENKPIRTFVNGKLVDGDPRAIKLESHTKIVLEVGPTFIDPPNDFTFPAGD